LIGTRWNSAETLVMKVNSVLITLQKSVHLKKFVVWGSRWTSSL